MEHIIIDFLEKVKELSQPTNWRSTNPDVEPNVVWKSPNDKYLYETASALISLYPSEPKEIAKKPLDEVVEDIKQQKISVSQLRSYFKTDSDYYRGVEVGLAKAINSLKSVITEQKNEEVVKLNLDTSIFDKNCLQLPTLPHYQNYTIINKTYKLSEKKSEIFFTVDFLKQLLYVNQEILVFSTKLDKLPMKMMVVGVKSYVNVNNYFGYHVEAAT